jgi:phosphoenolpyruvate carboxykinase (GTP)
MGANVSSEMTAAAFGAIGQLRRDPFAMLPFCGYNMGDYFGHWLSIGKSADQEKLPKIFHVNWFRKDENGKFLWPGYGENIRVLKWIFEQLDGKGNYEETPIGRIPAKDALDVSGLDISEKALEVLFDIDKEKFIAELAGTKEYFAKFGDRMPQGMYDELNELEARLKK